MDKDTLKELLRDYLDVATWTEFNGENYEVHTSITFDGETISEDSFEMACC